MRVSIIVSFRDRDIERVKSSLDSLALQTCRQFELIFIDYGSEREHGEKVRLLVESYQFARYYYSNTQGMFWNRAHALNTGIHFAKGEILLFSDIDLIFQADFLARLTILSYEGKFFTFSCYYLPEGQSAIGLSEKEIKGFKNHHVGLCAVKKESILLIRGFNEFYMLWGGEDDQLCRDLIEQGNDWIRFTVSDFSILHQWHPNHAPAFPTPWYLETIQTLYAEKEAETALCFGKLMDKSDRPVMNALSDSNNFKPFELYGNPWLQFNHYYIGFAEMESGGFGVFKFPDKKPEVTPPVGRKQKVVNRLNTYFKKWNFPYSMEKLSRPEPEMHTRKRWLEFITFFIGRNRKYLTDYFLVDTPEQLALYFQKK